MNRILIIYTFIIACILVISGCKGDKEIVLEEEERVPFEEPVVEEEEVEEVPKYTYPLIGIGTDDTIDHRPIGVVIENSRDARPQSGLHKADIVYEVLAEGNITRLLAIYQSEIPEIIGPVRSSRDYTIELSKGYDTLYVTHGWSPRAREMLEKERQADYISGIRYDGILFQRVNFRRAPHNSYITYENIIEGANREGYSIIADVEPLPSFLKDDHVPTGIDASKVEVRYAGTYTVSYQYNKATENYDRYSNNERTEDRETDIPVTVDNIFIVETTHRVVDNEGRRQIDLTSGGNAYLIQKGIAQEVEWVNRDGRILPVKAGQDVGFKPGKTWINIVQTSPGIKESVTIFE